MGVPRMIIAATPDRSTVCQLDHQLSSLPGRFKNVCTPPAFPIELASISRGR